MGPLLRRARLGSSNGWAGRCLSTTFIEFLASWYCYRFLLTIVIEWPFYGLALRFGQAAGDVLQRDVVG